MGSTARQLGFWLSLVREVRQVEPSEEEVAAFVTMSKEEASSKIDELIAERDSARGTLTREPA